MVQAIGYFKASNTGVGDQFGRVLALSADGSTLAVAAVFEDSDGSDESNNSAPDSGAVYVFTRTGTQWSQQAYVKASNTGAGDFFGSALALSADGSILAVGAPQEDGSATGVNNPSDENGATAGAVYVFTRTGTQWSQQAYVKASNTGREDLFGTALALNADGSMLAVGAPNEDSNGVDGEGNNGAGDAGAVYVFTREQAAWSQQSYVKAANAGTVDNFGTSVALSADGSTLAVGAPGESGSATGVNNPIDENAPGSGAAYVFTRAGIQWTQQAYVKASNTEGNDPVNGRGDRFGTSVALSGDSNTLAVGAPLEDSAAVGINDNDNQGDNSAKDAGAIYVFVHAAAGWSQQAYVKASNTEANDQFGAGIALSEDGNTVAVSAPEEDSAARGVGGSQNNGAPDAGAVYVFTRTESDLLQQAYVKASNPENLDSLGFGAPVLSADGNTLAVGSIREGSSATGVGGDQDNNGVFSAGAVYMY
jgi:hypothetical protein